MEYRKEAVNKPNEPLSKYLERYNKRVNSRQFQRMMNRKVREYDNKDDIEKENFIKNLLKDIEQRTASLTQEITEEYKKQGRNVNHANTFKSIRLQVNKRLTEYYHFNPDNIPHSIEACKELFFPNYEKQQDPLDKDNFIFDKKDEDLDPISRLGKQDVKGWLGTMTKLDKFKRDKRAGRIGMYVNQYGEFDYK